MSAVLIPPAPLPTAPPAGPPASSLAANPLGLPAQAFLAGLRRFTPAEYDELGRLGILGPADRVELLEGYVVHKMSQNPPHAGGVYAVQDVLGALLPAGWIVRIQSTTALPDSRPEPDAAVVRGDRRTYFARHPEPADFGVVIEVADTSRLDDRRDKLRVYARAGLPVYWIVNIPDRQVEVYTDPQPAANPPGYATSAVYKSGDAVPLVLDGAAVASVPVAELLP